MKIPEVLASERLPYPTLLDSLLVVDRCRVDADSQSIQRINQSINDLNHSINKNMIQDSRIPFPWLI